MKEGVLGIFDSGLGGLTVVKEVIQQMPYEDVVYLGDTARVPYGSKSEETVERFAVEILTFLSRFNLKMLVVACNTVSSVALEKLKSITSIPVIGVIKPGAKSAILKTRTRKIAIIGTKATILSNEYVRIIHSLEPDLIIHQKACPLFVPIIEEGWYDEEIAKVVASRYLGDLLDKDIDTVVLGCTHYPLIKSTIREIFGQDIILIDSAYETASAVRKALEESDLLKIPEEGPGTHKFFVTDLPNDFYKLARTFLEIDDIKVEKVVIDGILKESGDKNEK